MTTNGKNGRGTLSLVEIEGKLIPEEQTYQAKLRAAMAGCVGESDMTDIVKKIVEKAKAGDEKAQKMFFEYIAGVKSAPTKITVHNHFDDPAAAARLEQVMRRGRNTVGQNEG